MAQPSIRNLGTRASERVEWLNFKDAAAYIGLGERTLRRYVSEGKCPAARVGGERLIRIKRSDLDKLMQPIPTVGDAS